jgi:Linear amide C-N hydrolases, choloylglycine hydrolase family
LNTIRRIGAIVCAATMLLSVPVEACTRFIYRTGSDTFIVGRSMDWAENPGTDLWSFPRAMERDGGVGKGSIKWTSKFGSVISSFYNIATVEGMNDAGLVANPEDETPVAREVAGRLASVNQVRTQITSRSRDLVHLPLPGIYLPP